MVYGLGCLGADLSTSCQNSFCGRWGVDVRSQCAGKTGSSEVFRIVGLATACQWGVKTFEANINHWLNIGSLYGQSSISRDCGLEGHDSETKQLQIAELSLYHVGINVTCKVVPLRKWVFSH